MPQSRRISCAFEPPPRLHMLADYGFSTLETMAQRMFATKGEKRNGEAVRKSMAGADYRPRPDRADRGLPRLRLSAADRRSAERPAAMDARLLRRHLDRPALLFQLRADPDHADRSGRAQAGGE